MNMYVQNKKYDVQQQTPTPELQTEIEFGEVKHVI